MLLPWRGGGGQLFDADGKTIMGFAGRFTDEQMQAPAEHLGCPFRRYQKP